MYLYENSIIYLQSGYRLHNYYIKSILWILTAVYIYKIAPKVQSRAKERNKSYFMSWSVICGIIYVMVYMFAGAFNEFGTNPYLNNLSDALLGAVSEVSKIVGRESIRFFLLNRTYKKYGKLIPVFTLLMMITTEIPVIQIIKITTVETLVTFLIQILAPAIARNIFLNYISTNSNIVSSVIYVTFTSLFLLILPVLPILDWLIIGIISTAVPIFSYMFIASFYQQMLPSYRKNREKPQNLVSWILVSLFCISTIWFSVGIFDIFPSVIVTGSMEPLIYPGDMVLLEKITDKKEVDNLKIGDIIQFQRSDGLLILHRVIEVVNSNGAISYRTKGDNNSSEDSELVLGQNIRGTLYKIIPKVGIPTLIFKSDNNVDLSDVVY